jgi:hypothetical protein
MQSEPSGSVTSWILSPRQASVESTRIFDELPEASIVSGFCNVVDSLSSPTSVESTWIFDELPEASIISVSRPDPVISAPLSSLTLLKFNTNKCAMRSLFLFNFLLMLENFFKLYKLTDRIQTNLESKKS